MPLPLYLAMTPEEIAWSSQIPHNFAYLSCHFSSTGTGLSNFPEQIPRNGILILDDSQQMDGHDPEQIAEELFTIPGFQNARGVVLDFQQPGKPESAGMAEFLTKTLPCPVAVSHHYATALSGPVFLPPLPPDQTPDAYLSPWKHRPVWLEVALDAIQIHITESGAVRNYLPTHNESKHGFTDQTLGCHYKIAMESNAAVFTLYRTRSDLDTLLQTLSGGCIQMAIGLWQELG